MASVAAIVAENLVQPEVYASVGLDPTEAKAAARANTHYGDKLRGAVAGLVAFLRGRRPDRRRVRAALEARPLVWLLHEAAALRRLGTGSPAQRWASWVV